MKTWHIHIEGQVQGVGYRPFVYRVATEMDLKGQVSNGTDGVHIQFNAHENVAERFFQSVSERPPSHAIVTGCGMHEVPIQTFSKFSIAPSLQGNTPNLLLTPDIAICEECRHETLTAGNRRSGYPFTTCLHCGPRYSIITSLPYDRERTTMAHLKMCNHCADEYVDIDNRRHFSQTISCGDCAIPMHLYASAGEEIANDYSDVLSQTNELLHAGKIIAVKGIGGYLLLCDATNESAVALLRQRKQRPAKPFALLYADVQMMRLDAFVTAAEEAALKDTAAPIVLCNLKQECGTGICAGLIAPGLKKIGLMLPCSPLLLLISNTFAKPLIATSGNVSGSPIIYKDQMALQLLTQVADFVLPYEREIVMPQDDSVVQFTPPGQRIVLRRSRGLAPTFYPGNLLITDTVLAMGGELKSAFSLAHQGKIYVSQYLGDQGNVEAQEAYQATVDHLLQVLHATPSTILVDKHPGYFVSTLGRELATAKGIPVYEVQHHEAHFGAVLAENNLLERSGPVLGVIWDGLGFGDDDQIWGGEFMIFEDGDMHRAAHLDYFPQLLGDKMNREPRLSALSLLKNFPQRHNQIEKHFSEQEWSFYSRQIIQPQQLLTSSMGRFLDGIASLLGICHLNSYEGEAAMRLEALALRHRSEKLDYYPLPLSGNRLQHDVMLPYLFDDLAAGKEVSFLAWKIFCSLAMAIENVSNQLSVTKIAFSGGVFQNELLTDLVAKCCKGKELFFHRQLSPNDECIGYGQLASYSLEQEKARRLAGLSTTLMN